MSTFVTDVICNTKHAGLNEVWKLGWSFLRNRTCS